MKLHENSMKAMMSWFFWKMMYCGAKHVSAAHFRGHDIANSV